ncbi:MAG: recombinase family protein [Gammaproteobacteria bacterium]|nr:recombinase family protein [Gammaproteobacteria bacterium]
MIYGYISLYYNATKDVKAAMLDYAKVKGFKIDEIIEDPANNRVNWEKRALSKLLKQTLQPGDALVIYEASNLARSTSQILDILKVVAERNIILHMAKYDQIYPHKDHVNTEDFLTLVQNIESDFVAKRVTDALARRKAAGLPVGRPKGKLNRSLKLDKHRKDIQKYLDIKVSRASIAKLIGCNAQTLYNYIEKRQMRSQDAQSVSDKA